MTPPEHQRIAERFEGILNDDGRSRIKSELKPGERLLWASGSFPESELKPNDELGCLPILSVVALVSWALGIGAGFLKQERPQEWLYCVIAAAFIIGIAASVIAIAGFVSIRRSRKVDHRRSRLALQAITDRRVIVWKPDFGGTRVTVVSFSLAEIQRVWRVERDGQGFEVGFSLRGPSREEDQYTTLEEFQRFNLMERIPDGQRVEDLLRNSAIEARTRASADALEWQRLASLDPSRPPTE